MPQCCHTFSSLYSAPAGTDPWDVPHILDTVGTRLHQLPSKMAQPGNKKCLWFDQILLHIQSSTNKTRKIRLPIKCGLTSVKPVETEWGVVYFVLIPCLLSSFPLHCHHTIIFFPPFSHIPFQSLLHLSFIGPFHPSFLLYHSF